MWWKELRKNLMTQVALVFIALLIILVVFVPTFGLLDAESPNYIVRNLPPVFINGGNWEYPLGTD